MGYLGTTLDTTQEIDLFLLKNRNLHKICFCRNLFKCFNKISNSFHYDILFDALSYVHFWYVSTISICRNHMLDEETEEDFISDILQETVTSALDQIYYKIIEKQIIPYSVNAARELLLDVIEVRFLL